MRKRFILIFGVVFVSLVIFLLWFLNFALNFEKLKKGKEDLIIKTIKEYIPQTKELFKNFYKLGSSTSSKEIFLEELKMKIYEEKKEDNR
jgi:hypothetical protein